MTLGVANAFLDRSPLIAITASLARSAEPYATHQKLDLNAVYPPFTKLAITLDGENTAAKVRRAYRTTPEPQMGPVHIALPSDIARAQDRPVVCTLGDGGFRMTLAEIESCVRLGIQVLTVVYNDSSLSLIRASQANRGYPNYGVEYGAVDFAAAARALGAWAQRVESMDDLGAAVEHGLSAGRAAVIEVLIDPSEYRAHNGPIRKKSLVDPRS